MGSPQIKIVSQREIKLQMRRSEGGWK